MIERREWDFDELTDRQYEVLMKVAKALEVHAKTIYYNDSYLETMEKLAEKIIKLNELTE